MKIHCCQSVRGMLLKTDTELKNYFPDFTPSEIRDFFMDELAKGREVIPFGEPCEGFDYKKGCQGHEVEIQAQDRKE